MSFWEWYWVGMGVFAWGVFGMLIFMVVWCRLSDKYSKIHTHVFVTMILLAGPFVWTFLALAGLAELGKWVRNR